MRSSVPAVLDSTRALVARLRPANRFPDRIERRGGGDLLLPVPWARSSGISHLATVAEMEALLGDAGFNIVAAEGSTDRSIAFFEARAAQMAQRASALVPFHPFLGDDFPAMAGNMMRNLKEERIGTWTFVCE